MVDDCGTLIDMHTRDTFDYVSDVCDLLNELSEENEQLKSSDTITDLETKIMKLKQENEQLKKELKNGICPLCGARVSKCGGLK